MSSSTRSLLGVLLILVITFCGTFVVSRMTASLGGLDLTEDKLYTLNGGTISIIDRLPQPLTLKLFYSKEGVNKAGSDSLLAFNNYYYYVRDLLRAYQRQGGGKIIFTELDPKAFSDAEAEADRWRAELGGRMCELRYPDLTAGPVSELRKLCDFLALDAPKTWLDNCVPRVDRDRSTLEQTLVLPPLMSAAFNRYQERYGFSGRAIPKGTS